MLIKTQFFSTKYLQSLTYICYKLNLNYVILLLWGAGAGWDNETGLGKETGLMGAGTGLRAGDWGEGSATENQEIMADSLL